MKTYCLTLILILINLFGFGQVSELLKKSDDAYNKSIDSAEAYINKALLIATKNNNKHELACVYVKLIKLSGVKGDTKKGVEYFDKVQLLGDAKLLPSAYIALASVNENTGDYDLAISQYIKGIDLLDNKESNEDKYIAYTGLSRVFLSKEESDKSIDYCLSALMVANDLKNPKLIAGANFNLGNAYYATYRYKDALSVFFKALKYYEKMSNLNGIAQTSNNIGLVYQNTNNSKLAKIYFIKSYLLFDKLKLKNFKSYVEIELIALYTSTNEYKKADSLLQKAMNDNLGSEMVINRVNLLLNGYELYKKMGTTQKALKYLEEYNTLNDSINTKNKNDKINDLETKFRVSEKQNAIELLKTKNDVQNLELKKRSILIWLVIAICVIIAGIAIIIFIAKRKEKKVNNLLSEKNVKISHQQKEILDSINYAKRIQDATLGSIDRVTATHANSSIVYQPKDIISGDFYWVDKIDNNYLFAVADCTGHGVPGAMMSMIGTAGLNSAVKEKKLNDPSEILKHLSDYVKKNFTNTANEIKDGMDISFCKLDLGTNILSFAGAINSLFVKKSNGDLIEIKGDKQFIGDDDSIFTTKTLQLEIGDTVYIMSDGFCDQFGGDKGKKLKTTGFKSILSSINGLSATEQANILRTKINEWKNNLEQTDDICVIVTKI